MKNHMNMQPQHSPHKQVEAHATLPDGGRPVQSTQFVSLIILYQNIIQRLMVLLHTEANTATAKWHHSISVQKGSCNRPKWYSHTLATDR